MKSILRPKCPRCQAPTGQYHCDSGYCTWRICTKCGTPKEVLIFDPKGRFYVGKM